MDSIWSKKWPRIPADKRELPKKAEVVIVGGGMAGLLCAHLLQEAGVAPVVLEADSVCSGQTKNTTAKITSQHGLIYDKLTQSVGEETAIRYGKINEAAIKEFERIIKEKNISCGFERLSSYLYTKTENGEKQLERECAAAKKAGIRATLVRETMLPFPVKRALKYEQQAQFHPLEFLSGLVPDLDVYEHTRVVRIKDHEVITERGTMQAAKIVLASHFPFVNFPGFYFARMHQERSYVIALKRGKNGEKKTTGPGHTTEKQPFGANFDCLDGMYYGIDSDGLSFRNAEGIILLGGRSERTGIEQSEDPYQVLRREAKRFLPDHKEVAHWAAQDCMTLDKLPYIGRFSNMRPDWYVATGFEKWGMTNSMIAAMAIRDLITGQENPDWSIVSPQRKLTGSAWKSLAKEMATTTKNFVTFKKPRCPHLGCSLVWNPYERTWDCPCHGSRFAKEGDVIDNPAQKPMG